MYTNPYLENDIEHRDPVELVCLLYAKAIEKLGQAREHLRAGRIRERAAAISHVMEIIAELQGSLDHEQGPEIAETLDRLYGYIQERLSEANVRQRPEPLDEAAALLEVLYEGWGECRVQLAAGQEQEAASEPVPQPAAREWTL